MEGEPVSKDHVNCIAHFSNSRNKWRRGSLHPRTIRGKGLGPRLGRVQGGGGSCPPPRQVEHDFKHARIRLRVALYSADGRTNVETWRAPRISVADPGGV